MDTHNCYHCGNALGTALISSADKQFCCQGCKTVFELLTANNLHSYYELEQAPGAQPRPAEDQFNYLDNESIANQLLDFNENEISIVTLYIPHIHCSSCIWILENLQKLSSGIRSSQVDFTRKKLSITYKNTETSLKEIVTLLNSIGYEPTISLEDYTSTKNTKKDYSLLYKLGVAGFAFGNVMFLSFPEYFELSEFWLEKYKHLFRWLMFFFSLPVVIYAASDYFRSAYKGLKNHILNIDVPIALGIFVLFVRSTLEISFDWGTGFFDSLTGLVFFLLVGKFFQQKTYAFLSFERDYKSYFPIAVTRIQKNKNQDRYTEENIQLYEVAKNDILLIRHGDLIPVDCTLKKGNALIDYSFVTGESDAVTKTTGDKLYAGGKQLNGAIEVEVLKSVEQSYLTKLWGKEAFNATKKPTYITIIDGISKYFTISILTIAILASLFWLFYNPTKAMNVFTAVLIIACPCALALARPFALGNMLRIFGKHQFYVKNADVIEELTKIDSIIFDKTGTITTNKETSIAYQGVPLSVKEERLLKNALRGSSHPLSRKLYDILEEHDILTADQYDEIIGQGIEAKFKKDFIKVGSALHTGNLHVKNQLKTAIHIQTNDSYKGYFQFTNTYRKGIPKLFNTLNNYYDLTILSGDNAGEKKQLQSMLPKSIKLYFNHKPDQKLEFIKTLQQQNKKVMMIGDGLNDAGALAQSDVGIVVSEDTNAFSPACDAILKASEINSIPNFLRLAKAALSIIKSSVFLSFVYNLIGLYFAITGQLQPVIAAILMPLSSISIVLYVTALTNWKANKILNAKKTTLG
ncbi:heavy metal translocating P-type ATPase [Aquimarina brevivitae]|uniref:Cu+-exporting ATPase n=1 Tax=Aquimarina brevivitae TaxID=323412 RepID=A0A4Q7PH35_9FLAO|nr:heavy metal translocating P-type ATPase metal-binding domain-containing protein [Aquimarina brevivitae]RZS99695.1 Cu+-exporting ATPase [Aquimarina brevivitae]